MYDTQWRIPEVLVSFSQKDYIILYNKKRGEVSNELTRNNSLQIVSNDNTRRKSPFVDYEPTTSCYITKQYYHR